ncbi:GIY-YIG nuclease family protein [Arthrobacter sp. D1-17]
MRNLHATTADSAIGKTENGDADDAVATEALLHRRFAEQRVNKMNLRRKFFCVTLSQSTEGTPRRWPAEMGRRETTSWFRSRNHSVKAKRKGADIVHTAGSEPGLIDAGGARIPHVSGTSQCLPGAGGQFESHLGHSVSAGHRLFLR